MSHHFFSCLPFLSILPTLIRFLRFLPFAEDVLPGSEPSLSLSVILSFHLDEVRVIRVPELRQMKELKVKNNRLSRLLSDRNLKNDALSELISNSPDTTGAS